MRSSDSDSYLLAKERPFVGPEFHFIFFTVIEPVSSPDTFQQMKQFIHIKSRMCIESTQCLEKVFASFLISPIIA